MISLWLARMRASHLLWSYYSQRYHSAMCAYKVNIHCIHIVYTLHTSSQGYYSAMIFVQCAQSVYAY